MAIPTDGSTAAIGRRGTLQQAFQDGVTETREEAGRPRVECATLTGVSSDLPLSTNYAP